jgi:hypothetical protein
MPNCPVKLDHARCHRIVQEGIEQHGIELADIIPDVEAFISEFGEWLLLMKAIAEN